MLAAFARDAMRHESAQRNKSNARATRSRDRNTAASRVAGTRATKGVA
jgi:hypothetical protein